jgi:hypothetical protein
MKRKVLRFREYYAKEEGSVTGVQKTSLRGTKAEASEGVYDIPLNPTGQVAALLSMVA